MVNSVDETVNIDKQGRLIVPAHLRETLGIKEGGQVSLRLDGNKIVIEPISENLEKTVKEWSRATKNQIAQAQTEETQESWKWISHEYARKKLGLC